MATTARKAKTDSELDDEAIVAYVKGFVQVMAADWRRRQLNIILPEVLAQVDAARSAGHAPDVRAILDKVWLTKEGPAALVERP